jgi:transposase
MSNGHISFSELKNWRECPYKHKLTYLDRISIFEGNEYTAFGTAVHSVCEKLVCEDSLSTNQAELLFEQEFTNEINKLLDLELNQKLISDMEKQAKQIIPKILTELKKSFTEYEVHSTECKLFEPIEDRDTKFKGFVDLALKLPNDKYIILDWKTCSWGWDSRKKNDKMITYQLTLYKHFFAKKYNIDPKNIETYFALLKRTAKKNNVEIFRVTSGPKKTKNALKMLKHALHNIERKNYIKNRLSCNRCEFHKTEYCP